MARLLRQRNRQMEVQQAETKPVLTFLNPDHHRAEFAKTSTFMMHLVRVLMDASFHLLTSQNPAFNDHFGKKPGVNPSMFLRPFCFWDLHVASTSFITAARAAEIMGDSYVSMMTPSSRLCEAIEEFSGNSRPLR